MTPFQQEVYDAVKKIPRGRVSAYKVIARMIGRPNSARAVGNALNKNRDLSVPCHRVVCSDGNVGKYNKGGNRKIQLLKNEGVIIRKNIINFAGYLYGK